MDEGRAACYWNTLEAIQAKTTCFISPLRNKPGFNVSQVAKRKHCNIGDVAQLIDSLRKLKGKINLIYNGTSLGSMSVP